MGNDKKISILDELKLIKATSGNKETLPLPVYLFIRKYGREPYEKIEDIATYYGDEETLYFNVSSVADKSLINAFQVEIERKKKLGRDFTGFVHIELSDYIEEKAYKQFFRYLEERKAIYHFLFSIDNECNKDYIIDLLEQFFFIRIKESEGYNIAEQMQIVKSIVALQKIKVSRAFYSEIETRLEKHSWGLNENVKKRIECITNNGIYNCTISRKRFDENMLLKEFDRLNKSTSFKMGFAYIENGE